jgi:hypothetical protein
MSLSGGTFCEIINLSSSSSTSRRGKFGSLRTVILSRYPKRDWTYRRYTAHAACKINNKNDTLKRKI